MESKAETDHLSTALKTTRSQLATAFIFSTIANALLLTSPLFMLLIYDRVLSSRSTETLVSLLIIVVVLFIVMGLLDYSRRRLLARIGARLQQQLEETVFSAAHRPVHVTKSLASDAGVVSALDNIRKFFNSSAPIAIFDVLSTPIFLGTVFLFHYVIGWMGVVGVIVLVILLRAGEVVCRDRTTTARAASNRSSDANRLVKSPMRTIRSQGMVSSVRERWLNSRENTRIAMIALNDQKIWFSVIAKSVRLLLLSMVLATGAYFVLKGKLTVGAMIACSIMLNRVFQPVESFMKQTPAIVSAWKQWQTLKEKLIEADNTSDIAATRALQARVDVRDVSVDCPHTHATILSNISFTLEPGQVLQIAAPTGVGKTVLAQVIRGIFPFSKGEIRLDGEKIEHFSEDYLGKFFGFVPQQIFFVPGTLEENISGMELSPKSKAVIAAARKARTHRFIKNLPTGYKTKIDLEGSRFSDGQRRQFALARALYRNPRILIIDDLNGAFARVFGRDMADLFDGMRNSGGSVIVFTREQARLKKADQFLLLKADGVEHPASKSVTSLEKTKKKNNVSEFALSK